MFRLPWWSELVGLLAIGNQGGANLGPHLGDALIEHYFIKLIERTQQRSCGAPGDLGSDHAEG